MLISVSGPCPPTDGATAGRSGHRGLTRQTACRKAAVGPAARPKTPLAVENSVGEPAAIHLAPNAGDRERERGELPPPLWPRPVFRPTGTKVGVGVRHTLFPIADIWRQKGCRLPDAVLHGQRSYRPRSRAVRRLAAYGLLSEASVPTSFRRLRRRSADKVKTRLPLGSAS